VNAVKNIVYANFGKTPMAEGKHRTAVTDVSLPQARNDALAIAGQLWASSPRTLPLTLLFATPTAGQSSSRLLYETGLALSHVLGAAVLLVDLVGHRGPLTKLYTQAHRSGRFKIYRPWIVEGDARFALAHVGEANAPLLTAVTPKQFTPFLEFARALFPVVLLDVGSLPESVVSMLAANQCDGVVLCVRPGKSTQAEVTQARTTFAQATKEILGFILDEIS
jgi:Mrp family chromosome partitioning ATPase